jgi:hypothetical protein
MDDYSGVFSREADLTRLAGLARVVSLQKPSPWAGQPLRPDAHLEAAYPVVDGSDHQAHTQNSHRSRSFSVKVASRPVPVAHLPTIQLQSSQNLIGIVHVMDQYSLLLQTTFASLWSMVLRHQSIFRELDAPPYGLLLAKQERTAVMPHMQSCANTFKA